MVRLVNEIVEGWCQEMDGKDKVVYTDVWYR